MEFVNFGAAGVKVSKIALGLGFREQDSRQEAERVIEHAIYQGINFIDCSKFLQRRRKFIGRNTVRHSKITP